MNQESFKKQTEELNKTVGNLDSGDLSTANIIVAGITGTGKSTLINAVFGEDIAKTGIGRPITANINDYSVPEIPVRIWDTVGLELDSAKTEESIRNIRQTIANKASSKDPFDCIHAIWYCISAGSNRYQGTELSFIKNLYSIGVPFIIVITRCISDEDDDVFDKTVHDINQSSGMSDIEVIQVLAKDYKTRLGTIPSFGLDKLVKATTDKLPEFIKDGFIAAQRVDVVRKREQCEDIVIEYVFAAKNGFWDKVPIINILTTETKIVKMFEKIGKMYNTSLPVESIEEVTRTCGVDSKNNFDGLINPFDSGYKGKVSRFLEDMHGKDGFNVKLGEFSSSERAARMIAFYGYTFIMAIEELWNELTEAQLKDVEFVVRNLIGIINKKLNNVRRGQSGK